MTPPERTPNNTAELGATALLEALQSAHAPDSLEHEVNERLIESALQYHFQTASPAENGASIPDSGELICGAAEREDAENLARALDQFNEHPLADVAELLHNAHAPGPIARAPIDAFASTATRTKQANSISPLRRLSYASATLALAASVAVWMQYSSRAAVESAVPAVDHLAQSRSVAPLFAETYDQATPTQRIDRIYALRSRELRHNRYVTWRVR